MKKIVISILLGLAVLFFGVTVAGFAVKRRNVGRIAPGITMCGRELSGMTAEEAEEAVKSLLPEFLTELRCRFLPEMREQIEVAVREQRKKEGNGEEERGYLQMSVQGQELCLTVTAPVIRVLTEDTMEAVAEKSSEVKIWEWLYAGVTGRPFRIREAKAHLVWEEEYFGELLVQMETMAERDYKDATVIFENGSIKVTESLRGFRIEKEEILKEADRAAKEAMERLQETRAEGMVFRFYVNGTVLMPRVSTAQAGKCDTVIGEFTTGYTGAGTGRTQNIAAGAKKLHGKVILPGETFSVAEALQPFTEANGYAAGGTYIDGQLSESIGGGVCQLSTTLYNALLQTNLTITERYPHSMPVGYVPLGRDAAIAGDYKDLKWKNTTRVPVLLLCEENGTEVKVTLYGSKETKRGAVTFESVITEETEGLVTVEVYRVEKAEGGAEFRERVSVDRYREKKR